MGVKTRVKRIEVFGVQAVLCNPQCISKTLEVDDLALPQEYDRIAHIRVVDQPQDIVIGQPGFLFRSEILVKIGKRVTSDLKRCCRERYPGCCLRINPGGMIDKIGIEPTLLNIAD